MENLIQVREYEKLGYRLFPLNGKRPKVYKWQETEYKQYKNLELNDSFGINLQPDDLIIDVDPRGFKEGDRPLKRLVNLFPDIRNAPIVKTGGGGLHIYLKKPPEIKIKKTLNEFRGIDFLSAGCYVVGAGSIHSSLKRYKFVRGKLDEIIEAPKGLLDILKKSDNDKLVKEDIEKFDDSHRNKNKFIEYLKNHAPIAVEGQGGNKTTFKVACRGRDFGLSPDVTTSCMTNSTCWNKRCQPEWDFESLNEIVHNAYKYNEEPVGKFHPSSQFDPIDFIKGLEKDAKEEIDDTPQKPEESKMKWHLTKQGEWMTRSIHNICNFFNGYEETPELCDLLMYNTLSQNIEFTRKPFWLGKHETLTPWDDNDANAVLKFLSTKLSFNTSKNNIHDAALAVAQENKNNPVVKFLESLKWDGKKRIHNWLSEYIRVKEDGYTKTVGELMLRAAVRRAFDAGCKYDYMVVFEGSQGIGKSTIIEILGKEWYADLILNVHSPDTIDCMRNKWIIEVSEMECTKRADTQALKSFLTRRTDTCRLAYARTSKDFPRHNIFIGTFNPELVGTYLKDETGNRRYLPINVEGDEILDFKKFKKDVNQLWAETVVLYKENPKFPLYIQDEKILQQANEETWERRTDDAWLPVVEQWLEDCDGNGTKIKETVAAEIFSHAIGGNIDKLNDVQYKRISKIMVKELGWEKKMVSRDGKKQRKYLRPFSTEGE